MATALNRISESALKQLRTTQSITQPQKNQQFLLNLHKNISAVPLYAMIIHYNPLFL